METTPHIPVLRDQVMSLLQPQPGETYIDGTAGYGGHASMVLEQMGLTGNAILVDRDADALAALQQRFGTDKRVRLRRGSYANAAIQLQEEGITADMILLDLGVSSPQLDIAGRGFSFRDGGPLDMRMDQSQPETAESIVNGYREDDLANLIYQYSEERKSRRIAKAIVEHRPITTTAQLADVIAAAIGRHEDIHPGTRTFQALRIAVNDELGQLKQALPIFTSILGPQGRIAVISFHSLEDRIVKEFFRTESRDCICPPEQPVCTCDHVATLRILTKKPISGAEDAFNPRARSAKLRAAEKLTPKQRRHV